MTKEYIINYLTEHKDEFFQKFGITKLGLFSSYIRDVVDKNSDIDILVELENNLTNIHDKKTDFKQTLEKYLRPFDATMIQFVIIGEMISKFDDNFREEHSSILW